MKDPGSSYFRVLKWCVADAGKTRFAFEVIFCITYSKKRGLWPCENFLYFRCDENMWFSVCARHVVCVCVWHYKSVITNLAVMHNFWCYILKFNEKKMCTVSSSEEQTEMSTQMLVVT